MRPAGRTRRVYIADESRASNIREISAAARRCAPNTLFVRVIPNAQYRIIPNIFYVINQISYNLSTLA